MIQEVVAIIDSSGSMSEKESDTIGGINSTIKELKSNSGFYNLCSQEAKSLYKQYYHETKFKL